MDFDDCYYSRIDNLVASMFMMWSGVLWPRSRSNGLLRFGSLDMSTEAFDLMLLGEFFRFNRPVFREFMRTGDCVCAYTLDGLSKSALTIDGKKTVRYFYVYQGRLDSHVNKGVMDLYVAMSATEDVDGMIRVDHSWKFPNSCCQEHERCHGKLTTYLSWKSNKIEFVTI